MNFHNDDDDRMAFAEQLAEYDPRAGADALRAIARDHGVDDDIRMEANVTRRMPRAGRSFLTRFFAPAACACGPESPWMTASTC
jgi:hypothetical protein